MWAAGVTSDFVIIKAAENPTVHKFSKKCKTHFLSLMKRIENVESRQEYHFYKQGRMTNVIPRTPQKCDKKLKGVSTLGANMITNIYANNTLNKKRYTKRDKFLLFFLTIYFKHTVISISYAYLLEAASPSWPSPLALWLVRPTKEGRGEHSDPGEEAPERWVPRTSWV